jgi:predicted Fe-Mo cluster-binding NifX family protein/MinD-like ATPase involved in chromosome partitioning or flagellar assembly
MLGVRGGIQPSGRHGKALPVQVTPNLQVISIEVLMGDNKDTATIWRGPLKIGVIRQFISDMDWADLDYLVLDSPPGTGDEPLTVAQTIPDARAVIVTTPQEISLADVRKSIHFCRQVNMDILGVVENMNGLICPHCGKKIDLFGAEGGKQTARKEGLTLLSSLPIDPDVVRLGDTGQLSDLLGIDSAFTRELQNMIQRVVDGTQKKDDSRNRETEARPEKKDSDKGARFAIPVSDGKLSAHFGHPEFFALIETENGVISNRSFLTPPPHEPGVLPRWLGEQGVDIVIAGGIGGQAQQLLEGNGIQVITGAPQDAPEVLVNQYLSGTLVSQENVCDHGS